MPNLLFVSKSELKIEFAQLFKEAGYTLCMQARSATEARRIINEKDIEVIVINAPLPDEFGIELALAIEEKPLSNAIMVANVDVAETVEQRLEGTSAIVLAKPVSRRQIYKTLTFLKAQSIKTSKLISQNQKLEEKLEEFKLISRAKMLLIEKNKMSEEAAHKLLDKTAKDQRRTKKEVAKSIIDMYN